MKMTRSELYKALEGKKVVCRKDCYTTDVGVFHKGRMAFSITHFKPLKRIEPSCTTYFLQKGDYIEDAGKYICISRNNKFYMFIFYA